MEKEELITGYRIAWIMMILCGLAGFSFLAGIIWSTVTFADTTPERKTRTVYPGKTELDFEGAQIEGELRNPGEFYFQHRPEEKFDSLIKRRKNFRREMLRDVVFSK